MLNRLGGIDYVSSRAVALTSSSDRRRAASPISEYPEFWDIVSQGTPSFTAIVIGGAVMARTPDCDRIEWHSVAVKIDVHAVKCDGSLVVSQGKDIAFVQLHRGKQRISPVGCVSSSF